MCRQMIMVAEVGERRYAACCEHGTIHLGWGMVTLSIVHLDFLQLRKLCEQPPPAQGEIRQGAYRLAFSDGDYFILSIGTVALRLTMMDYLQFGTLVRRALDRLDKLTPAEFAHQQMKSDMRNQPRTQTLAQGYSFSRN